MPSDTHSVLQELERWNGSLFSLSLVTNVVVTTLIAARIWYVASPATISDVPPVDTPSRFTTRETKDFKVSSSFRYTKVLVLIIESAAIYSAALVIEITLYFIGSNAFYIVYDPIAQLTVSSNGPLPTVLR